MNRAENWDKCEQPNLLWYCTSLFWGAKNCTFDYLKVYQPFT